MHLDLDWKAQCGFPYNKDTLDRYCNNDKDRKGVYMIWYETKDNHIHMVYVGSGSISRLWDHLNENWFTKYPNLKANYAIMDLWEEAEKYLAKELKPLEGKKYPANVRDITTNLPDCFKKL